MYVQPGSSVEFLVSKLYFDKRREYAPDLHGQRAHGRWALAGVHHGCAIAGPKEV